MNTLLANERPAGRLAAQQPPAGRGPEAQRGAVLLLTLIVLVVLLLGGVALVRSFDTTLLTAGNIAFKRDLVNQGERVVPLLLGPNGIFVSTTGPLDSATERGASSKANNYSAAVLPTNPQGIPLALLNDAAFNGVANPANDITGDGDVKVRYVIDRMCNAEGQADLLGEANCILAFNNDSDAVSASDQNNAENSSQTSGLSGARPIQAMYRISVRINGPRGTQAFLQTTFAL